MPNLHIKTGPVCHILLLSIYIFATYLQWVNLCKSIFSIQEKFKCLYLESLCSAFIQVAQTFSKSCLKVALALVNLLPSFCISDRVSSFLWPQVDFRVRKTFFLNEFLHFVAAILEIVVPLGQRRWPATENSIAQKGLLNYLAFCFACFTKTLISQAFKQLSWYCGVLRPPLVSDQFSKML